MHSFGWLVYYWRLRHLPPRGTALKAIKALENRAKTAPILDFATGHGPDALAFLAAGWQVVALDKSQTALWICRWRAWRYGFSQNLDCIRSDFHKASFPACAGVNASFALPFCRKEHFSKVWQRLFLALEPGGIFSGQFFGVEDNWNQNLSTAHQRPTLHLSQQEVETLFKDFTILDWKEVKGPGKDMLGQEKNWHVYHVVAEKKHAYLS